MLSVEPILDHEQLRAFATFSESLNFTRAAERIGLSQPALHDRVRKLAESLGVPLYRRDGRRLELTPEGLEVAAFARRTLAGSAALVARLKGATEREEISLAAGEGSFLFLLGPAIAAFGHPLEPLTLGGPSTLEAVLSGRAHLGVGVFDLLPRGLASRPITSVRMSAAMHRRHPLAQKKHVRLADLAGERLILAPPGQKHRDIVGRAVAAVSQPGPSLAPITADGWSLMLAFAAMKLGVAVVNEICAAPRGVVSRPIPELGRVTYRLVWRRDAPPSPARDALAELIASAPLRHART